MHLRMSAEDHAQNGDLAARPIVQLDFRGGCRSSECSEKPNDPPGKPAGFVYNNEAVRPAVGLRLNVDSSDCLVRPNGLPDFPHDSTAGLTAPRSPQ